MTLQGHFDSVNDRKEQLPHYEPPHEYSIEISEGRHAFVRTECILHRFGMRQTSEDDFFTFVKSGEDWKLLSTSFTAAPLPEEERVFDLVAFATSYAQVWGSTRPEFVAMFFTENGSLRINDDEPATGRQQISGLAQGFMTDIPNMRVNFDSLTTEPDRMEFSWTPTGTHATTGNQIKVSGSEQWRLENNLIASSQGHFPSEEYQRQI